MPAVDQPQRARRSPPRRIRPPGGVCGSRERSESESRYNPYQRNQRICLRNRDVAQYKKTRFGRGAFRERPIHVLSAPSKVENEELAQEMTPIGRDRGESSGFTHPHGSEAASGGGGRGAGGSSLLRRGERRLTRIAMAIVWLFLVCHMWKIIPTIFEAVYGTSVGWPAWLWKVKDLSHTLIVLNSAVNFLLYKLL